MSVLNFISASPTIQVAMFLSRLVPAWLGDRLLWTLSGLVARARPAPFCIVRDNLRQVLGPSAEARTLDRAARYAIFMVLHSSYDLFRAVRLPKEERIAAVHIPGESQEVIRSLSSGERGSLLVFPHLGNFDLGGQAIAAHVPEVQVITLPDPPPGFQVVNELRSQSGAYITPLSPAALRQAIRLLKRGGVVCVAGDRPVSDLDEPYPFFGKPARLPSGHVRLALKTDSVVVVACCVFVPERHQYTIYFEPPVEMIRTGDHEQEVHINMQRVLSSLEAFIRRWPEQWQMFVPVWPQLLEG